MANEINISAVTGLSPYIKLYSGATVIGSTFYATEIGTTGEYVANMPTTLYGKYLLIVFVGTTPAVKIASGEILWGGDKEITEEYAQILGLNPTIPSITDRTTKSWIAGNINLSLSGDLENTTTVTRI